MSAPAAAGPFRAAAAAAAGPGPGAAASQQMLPADQAEQDIVDLLDDELVRMGLGDLMASWKLQETQQPPATAAGNIMISKTHGPTCREATRTRTVRR